MNHEARDRQAGFEKHLEGKMEELGHDWGHYTINMQGRRPTLKMTMSMSHSELAKLAEDLKPDFNPVVKGDTLVFKDVPNLWLASQIDRVARRLTAATNPMELAKLLKKENGEDFKANWTGAWDRAKSNRARVVTINRGSGFEDSVAVDVGGGTMIYMAPFEIDTMPDDKTMLLFKCDNALFIKEL